MVDITDELQVVEFGVYGEDVRGAIHDALEKLSEATGGTTLITKSVTENGTYNAEDDNADGYSSVSVNVPSSFKKSFDFTSETLPSKYFNFYGSDSDIINNYTPSPTGLNLQNKDAVSINVYSGISALLDLCFFVKFGNVTKGTWTGQYSTQILTLIARNTTVADLRYNPSQGRCLLVGGGSEGTAYSDVLSIGIEDLSNKTLKFKIDYDTSDISGSMSAPHVANGNATLKLYLDDELIGSCLYNNNIYLGGASDRFNGIPIAMQLTRLSDTLASNATWKPEILEVGITS